MKRVKGETMQIYVLGEVEARRREDNSNRVRVGYMSNESEKKLFENLKTESRKTLLHSRDVPRNSLLIVMTS